jgi:uncharacterized RDD family membrane protein YckC
MAQEDPYQPPSTPEPSEAPATPAADLATASHATRFFNFVVDSIIGMMAVIFSHSFLPNSPEPGYLSIAAVYFGYYFVMEGLTSRTLGKLATGTKVVNFEGGRLSFSQLFTRTLMRFLPFEPLSFLGQEPEGWHDTFSRSFVVKSR